MGFQIKEACYNVEEKGHEERMEINWGKKHRDKNHFLLGRDGDHTMVCFECDTCIFRKLKGRDPIKEKMKTYCWKNVLEE